MFTSLLPKPKQSNVKPVNLTDTKITKNRLDASKGVILLPDNPVHKAKKLQLHGSQIKDESVVDYEAIISTSLNLENRKAHKTFEDSIPLKVKFPNLKHFFPRYTLENCPDNSLRECLEDTKKVISNIIEEKLGTATKNTKEVEFKSLKGASLVSGNEVKEKIIEVRNLKEDPMQPAKFKLRKNRHREPSPPPPVLKPKVGKVSKEDQDKWRIPAALSNWKNNQGFAISIDKRLKVSNDPSKYQTVDESSVEKSISLADALEEADIKAREEIKIRNEMMRNLALEEQHKKKQRLQEIASIAREKRHDNSNRDSFSGNYKRRKN